MTSVFGADMPGAAGETTLFAINWLVEGQFYSVFSILLGVGCALQADRAMRRGSTRPAFAAFFRRRMMILVIAGLTHVYALWSGDILTLYGVMAIEKFEASIDSRRRLRRTRSIS